MSRVIEGVTIETLADAIRQADIRPGQPFAIMLDPEAPPTKPKLTDIAARLRATATARGLTTEIFDTLISER